MKKDKILVTIYEDGDLFMIVNETGQMIEDGFGTEDEAFQYIDDNNYKFVPVFFTQPK